MTRYRRDAIELFLAALLAVLLATVAAVARGQSCGPGGCPLPGRGVGIGVGIGVGGWGQRPRQQPEPAPSQESAPPATCRIGNNVRGAVSYGSGTLVSYDGITAVITVRHLLTEGAGEITLTFPGGQVIQAAGCHTDASGADLAVILVSQPPAGVAPLSVSAGHPMQGDTLRAGGFGQTGQWRWIVGKCQGYVRDRQGAEAATCFELAGAARQGDSGGPVLNERGEVCGVLWGTDRRETIATYSGKIRAFLSRVAAKVGRSNPAPSNPPNPSSPPVVGPIEPQPETPVMPTPGQQAGQPEPAPPLQQPPQLAPQIQERLDSLAAILKQQAASSDTLAAATTGLDQRIADRLGPVIAAVAPKAMGLMESILPAAIGSLTGVGAPAAIGLAVLAFLRRRKAGTQPVTDATKGLDAVVTVPSPAATVPVSTPAVQAIPVVVESRPSPQQVVTQREFVQVSPPCNGCKATKMAHDYYAKKYPGGEGAILAMEEFARQYLSGLNANPASTST